MILRTSARYRRDLESSLETLQGPVVDGVASAESADTGRGQVEDVDNHDRPHDAEKRHQYVYSLACETELKAQCSHSLGPACIIQHFRQVPSSLSDKGVTFGVS